MIDIIAERYAKALFETAKEANQIDDIHNDLHEISILCQASEDFRRFISSPIITVAQKKNLLTEVFQGRLKPQTFNFLLFLIDKDRLELVKHICTAFESLYLSSKDILHATIQSKVALSETQVNQITEKFKKIRNKNIETQQTIQENMLGGFKVQINDMVYDYSIDSKLKKFKSAILNQ
ncbi:MAG: F0F1 ATP synthase subunit delta [Candidatus Omnitrophica bacterium]|nr:F0F1 ATP synthase subunit delta [Candidatus Omnitrophota bacterium]